MKLPTISLIHAVADIKDQTLEVGSTLGAWGAGIRFTLAKKNRVNLRVDYAVGLQGGGIYMGVTEAF
ncbi:MAG TPA: hypothetical protein VGV15_10175 [Terriglobales bacterium]|nr:hypothetical protein [Terriglobales bacterium]